MAKKTKLALAVAMTAATLAGCQSGGVRGVNPNASDQFQVPVKDVVAFERITDGTLPAEIVMRKASSTKKASRHTLNHPSIRLIDALFEIYGKKIRILPEDERVDLGKPIKLYAVNATTDEITEQLTSVSAYDIRVEGDAIRIASLAHRNWNIASMATDTKLMATIGQSVLTQSSGSASSGSTDSAGTAANSSGSSSDSSPTSITTSDDADVWESLIENAKAVIKQGTPEGFPEPVVTGNRMHGVIHALGYPPAIARLDSVMSKTVFDAKRQINLAVKMYEVALEDSDAQGVDWSAVLNGAFNNNLDLKLSNKASASLAGSNAFDVSLTGRFGSTNLGAALQFLQKYGTVNLVNEPNITVTNGRPAYISAGTEQSFIGSVQQSQDRNGNIQVSPVLNRVKLGISLSLSARYTDDGRIAITMVPVLSSLQGLTEFSFSGLDFRSPDISLQEMATTAIVAPGEALHVGGMISRKLIHSVNEMPLFKDAGIALVDSVKGSRSEDTERRELFIQVVPTPIID